MRVNEILLQIEALPTNDRWVILEHTCHLLEPDVPAEVAEGMAAIDRVEIVDLDDTMPELRGE